MKRSDITEPYFGVTASAERSIEDGALLSARYRIVRLLGRGGMGEVYEAVDEELGIGVALKILRHQAAASSESLRALKREVLLARLVTHPNVCRVYDVGRAGDVWFITMELLRGETLAERLGRSGPVAPAEAMRYAQPMIDGLAAAHRAGVVHRDFKPENTMIVKDGAGERIVVTDFGIARTTTAPAESGASTGTAAYMSPEQVRGEATGPASDVYSLGVVLFLMVTGHVPFEGGASLAVAARRLYEAAPSARAFAPDLDVHWEQTIARCLALQPEERFASVAAVARALAGEVEETMASAAPSLPAELTPFFGRESELAALEAQLTNGTRLVSLLGPGGMGKTRLAVHFGRKLSAHWPGGVWFCDLTEAASRDAVLAAVAGSLGLPLGRADAVAQLGLAIAGRGDCLLIFDNLEQITVEAGPLIAAWMERAPQARFLVTSRERLQIASERPLMLAQLTQSEAVTLFMERAHRHRPGLEFDDDEQNAVQQLVTLLDGMPLAIELAAARLRVLTARQVHSRMNERFRLLSGGRGRHATLATTLDASWDLVEPWERATWAQLSVFQAGFTLEAAEQVVDLSPWPGAPWVLDVIQSLVDKSILRAGTIEDGSPNRRVRFGMYVSLQVYAAARLASADAIPGATGPDALRDAEQRHGRYFATFGAADAIRDAEKSGASGPWSGYVPELENLVAACRRALGRNEFGMAAANYLAAAIVLDRLGPFSSALNLGQQVLAAPLEASDRLRVLLQIARIEWRAGLPAECAEHFGAALKLARELGDAASEGTALLGQAHLFRESGKIPEARDLFEGAMACAQASGDRNVQLNALLMFGIAVGELGDLRRSKACHEEALALARADENRRIEMVLMMNLGVNNGRLGHDDEQLALYEAVVPMAREFKDRRLLGHALNFLAQARLKNQQHDEAARLFQAALKEVREMGDRRSEAVILGGLGNALLTHGSLEEALEYNMRALAIARDLHEERLEADFLRTAAEYLIPLGRMDEAGPMLDQAEALLGAGSDPSVRAAYLAARAVFEFRRGNHELARTRIAEAEALALEIESKETQAVVAKRRATIGT